MGRIVDDEAMSEYTVVTIRSRLRGLNKTIRITYLNLGWFGTDFKTFFRDLLVFHSPFWGQDRGVLK